MALAGLQRRLDHPHAVQLVAQVLGVDVQRRDDVLVLQLRVLQPVAVVRHVDLALAHQLPVVAVRRPVEQVELVGGPHVVGGRAGIVVRHLRRAPHAALSRVVQPRIAGLLHLVERLVHEQDAAGQPRRPGHGLLEVQQPVVQRGGRHGRQGVDDHRLLFEGHGRELAAARRRRLRQPPAEGVAAVAQQVVPDHLRRPSSASGTAGRPGRRRRRCRRSTSFAVVRLRAVAS